MPVDKDTFVIYLKWLASHVASIGGLATAIAMLFTGEYANAFTALIAALAGFGLNVTPAKQATL